MKKEIDALIASESGTLEINSWCVLRRSTTDWTGGGRNDLLYVEFFGGNRHSVRNYSIKSRDWRGVVREIAEAQEHFYRQQTEIFNRELLAGRLFDAVADTVGWWEVEAAPAFVQYKKKAENHE